MQTYARLMLHPGEVLRIDGDETLELVCENGEFWITANSGEDHHLHTGESTACTSGRIVLEGHGTLLVRPLICYANSYSRWLRRGSLSRLSLRPAPSRTQKGI